MEIRVSLACPDDNAIYRRLFWDLKNFAFQEMPTAPRSDEMEACRWNARRLESAANLYHKLFDKPLDAALVHNERDDGNRAGAAGRRLDA